MSKLRRNTNPTLQGAPPSCESLRILALAPCDPPGDVPPTRIPRTARDGAQSVKPVATRMGAARWRRRVAPKPPLTWKGKGFFLETNLACSQGRPKGVPNFHLRIFSQSVSQLFHGPAPRSPLKHGVSYRSFSSLRSRVGQKVPRSPR